MFAFYSCAVNNNDIARYKNKFETHKTDFDVLVSLVKNQDLKAGYPINLNNLPTNIRKLLTSLAISDVNINLTKCSDLVEYEFRSSWSSRASLYFSKSSCNKEQSVIGYHDKTSKMIEVWGLGDGWTMWIDYDGI